MRVAAAVGSAFWIITGYLAEGELFIAFIGYAVAYLLHVAAAALSLRWSSGHKRTRSRVAMLYDRYLGIDGRVFVWKVRVFTQQPT